MAWLVVVCACEGSGGNPGQPAGDAGVDTAGPDDAGGDPDSTGDAGTADAGTDDAGTDDAGVPRCDRIGYPSVPRPAIGSASDLAVSDLDGDSHLDLVAALHSGNIGVLLGRGDGTFDPRVEYPAGQSPTKVVAADLNHDGKPDVVTSNSGPATVSVLVNAGDGTLQPRRSFPTGMSSFDIAVGDINGDGHPDIAIANFSDGLVSALNGNGDGTFQPQREIAAARPQAGFAIADLSGDGVLDLVTGAVRARDAVSVWIGNGDGTFQAAVDYPTILNLVSVPRTVADLDGDGDLDLAVFASVSHPEDPSIESIVSVLAGNGDGTFRRPVGYPVPGTGFLAAADVSSDGILDIVVFSHLLAVLLGNGDGTFQAAFSEESVRFGTSLSVADMNEDGKADVVTSFRLFFGLGNGRFVQPPVLEIAAASGGRADRERRPPPRRP